MNLTQTLSKFNKIKGYLLIELLISLAIYSIISITLLTYYHKIHQLYIKLTTTSYANNTLNKIMMIISNDISHSGCFGSYNLHYLTSLNDIRYNIISNSDNLCNLEQFKAGQGLYYQPNAISIAYGSNNSNAFLTTQNSDHYKLELSNLSFFYNNQELNNNIMLFNYNQHLYSCITAEISPKIINYYNQQLILFNSNAQCFEKFNLPLPTTTSVMNLTIKQYFITNHNLYYHTVQPNCSNYSPPVLMAENIKSMLINYYLLNQRDQITITNSLSNINTPFNIFGIKLTITTDNNITSTNFIPF